jgi:hypothetical protein
LFLDSLSVLRVLIVPCTADPRARFRAMASSLPEDTPASWTGANRRGGRSRRFGRGAGSSVEGHAGSCREGEAVSQLLSARLRAAGRGRARTVPL